MKRMQSGERAARGAAAQGTRCQGNALPGDVFFASLRSVAMACLRCGKPQFAVRRISLGAARANAGWLAANILTAVAARSPRPHARLELPLCWKAFANAIFSAQSAA